MNHLRTVEDLLQNATIEIAVSRQQKLDAYRLRFHCSKADYPELKSIEQVIDERDSLSFHLLLRHTLSGAALACIRLRQHSQQRDLRIGFIDTGKLEVAGMSLNDIGLDDYFIVDRFYTNDNEQNTQFKQLMLLAAYSVARLKFRSFLVTQLMISEFKALRAKGILLEQTQHTLPPDYALFYLSCDQGIAVNSASWETYQHLLGILAPQLNQLNITSHDDSGDIYQAN